MTLAEQEIKADYIPGFGEEEFNRLDTQNEPVLLRAKREEAFSVYKMIPAPTAFTEAWRRTDPALLPFTSLTALPVLRSTEPEAEGPWDHHFDVVVSIRDDGFAIADQSGAGARGDVVVLPLSEATAQHPEWIKTHLQGAALPASTGKFEALVDAFWNVGLFIHIPARVHLKKGILIRHAHVRGKAVILPRVLVVTGEQSVVRITEHFVSGDRLPFMALTNQEVYAGIAARLKLVMLKEWGDETFHVSTDMARVERDGQVDLLALNLGGKLSKMKFGSDVAGANASAELDGLFFLDSDQHADQTTLQVHSSPDTYSRLLYKGVVKDESHSVYQGVIQAKPGAIRVDAYQTNNNIVLDNGARADTIPRLLIDADDLKCSHGATIGNLDEDQVFYLRARGLSEPEAREIVMLGFFDEVVDRVPHDFIREWVHDRLRAKIRPRMDADEIVK